MVPRCFHSSWLCHQGVKLLGNKVTVWFNLQGTCRLFARMAAPFYIPTRSCENSNFSKSFYTLSLSGAFHITTLVSVKWYFIVVLVCICPLANGFEHLFTYLVSICVSSSVKYLFRSFSHFKIGLFVFFLLNCQSSLYILNTVCDLKISSPFCGLYFHFLMVSCQQSFFFLFC